MKRFLTYLVTLLTGAGAGFLVARSILEKKYALLAEEEIESVKEIFDQRRAELEAEYASKEAAVKKPTTKKPASKVEEETSSTKKIIPQE